MPLEIPREVPRPADSGARKRSIDVVQSLRTELNQLQEEYAENKRNADWGSVGGDEQAAQEGKVAVAWLENVYPKLGLIVKTGA